MNDDFFAFILLAGLVLAIFFGIGYGLVQLFLPGPPPLTARQQWEQHVTEKCRAMRPNIVIKDGVAECYHTPFMRQPSLRFKEKFLG